MIRRLAKYKNGNYSVSIFSNGTKIRSIPDGVEPEPIRPENIDIKLTDVCNIGCPYCHENSTSTGKGFALDDFELETLAQSMGEGIEVALGGGALTTFDNNVLYRIIHNFLKAKAIVNVTLNQEELSSPLAGYIVSWINGAAGISFRRKGDPALETFLKNNPKTVVHVINGLTTKEDFEYLKSLNCKILTLGYKTFRRGEGYQQLMEKYIEKNMRETEQNILDYMSSFRSVSFDTLALEQLNIKDKVAPELWERCYLGDDGQYTMYLDLVKKQYARNSTQPENERHPLPPSFNIQEMFQIIRKEENAKLQNK